MTYTASGGTLNPTHALTQSLCSGAGGVLAFPQRRKIFSLSEIFNF